MKKVNKDSWVYSMYVSNKLFKGKLSDMDDEVIKAAINEKKYLPEDNCDLYLGAMSYGIGYTAMISMYLIILGLIVCAIGALAYNLYIQDAETLAGLKSFFLVVCVTLLASLLAGGVSFLLNLKVTQDVIGKIKARACKKVEID